MTTSTAYSPLQKKLHWAVVALLLLQYIIFDGMGRPYHQLIDSGTMPWTLTTIMHLGLGVAVLALAAWRLVLRRTHGAPEAPAEEPELARKASVWGHRALYLMLFALPLEGLIAWFGQITLMAEIHEISTNLLLLLAAGHVGAALVHQFVWKTNLLARMK